MFVSPKYTSSPSLFIVEKATGLSYVGVLSRFSAIIVEAIGGVIVDLN